MGENLPFPMSVAVSESNYLAPTLSDQMMRLKNLKLFETLFVGRRKQGSKPESHCMEKIMQEE